jgi:hypothetical protein
MSFSTMKELKLIAMQKNSQEDAWGFKQRPAVSYPGDILQVTIPRSHSLRIFFVEKLWNRIMFRRVI